MIPNKRSCAFSFYTQKWGELVIGINNYPYIGGSAVLKKHQDSNPTPQRTTVNHCEPLLTVTKYFKPSEILRQIKFQKVSQL